METLTLIALILVLALACVVGLQLFYLSFLDIAKRQQSRRIAELEREVSVLTRALEEKDAALTELTQTREEAWPEYVEDETGS